MIRKIMLINVLMSFLINVIFAESSRINGLEQRIEYLENKVCELQSGVGVNTVFQNPITIEEFLDSYNEKDDYKTWISEIEIEDDDLQHLFDNNREMCIVRLLDKQRENIPLLCLIENPNIIYKYEE